MDEGDDLGFGGVGDEFLDDIGEVFFRGAGVDEVLADQDGPG